MLFYKQVIIDTMLRDIRKQYERDSISEKELFGNPYSQFKLWLDAAINSSEAEPTAMVLSTVDENQQAHSRVVLLKDLSEKGLTFYTNYEGNKGLQISKNNKVSALFFWQSFERQVRITGICRKISAEESTDYFKSRPHDSQIAAWTSPQSKVIENYEFLEKRFTEFQNKFGNDIPKPNNWGGYIIEAVSFEFWQGRPNRLHDRIYYSKEKNKHWKIERLAP
jgi:pyridoxamine 5'-phosphate oxidase